MKAEHLRWGPIAEMSVYPKYRCKVCGELLWEECSLRTNGKAWLVTKDGRRHYRSKCNLRKGRQKK